MSRIVVKFRKQVGYGGYRWHSKTVTYEQGDLLELPGEAMESGGVSVLPLDTLAGLVSVVTNTDELVAAIDSGLVKKYVPAEDEVEPELYWCMFHKAQHSTDSRRGQLCLKSRGDWPEGYIPKLPDASISERVPEHLTVEYILSKTKEAPSEAEDVTAPEQEPEMPEEADVPEDAPTVDEDDTTDSETEDERPEYYYCPECSKPGNRHKHKRGGKIYDEHYDLWLASKET